MTAAPHVTPTSCKRGDVLEVSVWKETDLQKEVLIRPDGGFTFPLAGEVDARGKSVESIRSLLVDRLQKYVPTPVVTVAVKSIGGNRIYVLGKVNRAGDFPLSRSLDVMQAISLAGGTTPYAAVNDIVILRTQIMGGSRCSLSNTRMSHVAAICAEHSARERRYRRRSVSRECPWSGAALYETDCISRGAG